MGIVDPVLFQIAARTIVIYAVVLVGLRLTGKREVGQMTPVDLVLLLLLANAVQNAMTGPDTSLAGGIVAALVLLGVNKLATLVMHRSARVRSVVEGTPTVLISDGAVIRKNLDAERITPDELRQALREHGVDAVADVHLAMLEIDGSISVLKKDDVSVVSRPHRRIQFRRKP